MLSVNQSKGNCGLLESQPWLPCTADLRCGLSPALWHTLKVYTPFEGSMDNGRRLFYYTSRTSDKHGINHSGEGGGGVRRGSGLPGLQQLELRRVRTLYACVGEHETELSFEPNQVITNGK